MKKINYFDFGFVKCSAISPKLYLAKPMKNAEKVIELAKQESKKQSLIVLFPELGLTGYTVEDLFLTSDLLNETHQAISFIIKESIGIKSFIVVGHPYQTYDGRLYNCASIILDGKLLAMIPKSYLPSYNEFYEKRWMNSGLGLNLEINDFGQTFTLDSMQIINYNNQVIFGVEICEDLFAPKSPSNELAMAANLILNLSASPELVTKAEFRRELVAQQSARLNCAYLYTSASVMESSKEVLFSGAKIAAENGSIIGEGERFSFEDTILNIEFDLQKIAHERRLNTTFGSTNREKQIKIIHIQGDYSLNILTRKYPKNPFVPTNPITLASRTEEILQIQSTGLARKMLSVGNGKPKLVLGLSGGMDSTLALLVCLEAVKKLGQPTTDIFCYSLPGFGTSPKTKSQSKTLAILAGVTFEEIDIKDSVLTHFKDIGHDSSNTNVVYENAQARQRMLILFQKANQIGGFVCNTSSMSEIALGWSTFGSDHLGHYGVNVSIPKTLIKHLISYYKENKAKTNEFKKVLQDVLDTKISPELLPPDQLGNIVQDTQSIIGPYILHDFFSFQLFASRL